MISSFFLPAILGVLLVSYIVLLISSIFEEDFSRAFFDAISILFVVTLMIVLHEERHSNESDVSIDNQETIQENKNELNNEEK